MTIHLPENLESSILATVQSGRFASLDDAMAEAARLLLRQLDQGQASPRSPTDGQEQPARTDQPIWDVVEELRKGVPAEEFAKLPRDGAEQLDHYLYGSPKRPTG
jgi:Arc/MetJ-type ribon-helix-helix transcriptional regulator